MTTLIELAKKLKENLNKNGDIKNFGDIKNLKDILLEYSGDDYKRYCDFSDKSYTRNLIFRDEHFEILILCWNKHQKSGIHNHPEKGCLVRVLEGSLRELCYDGDNRFISENIINKDDISYQKGYNGRHNIVNGKNRSVTLHVYSPPDYEPDFF